MHGGETGQRVKVQIATAMNRDVGEWRPAGLDS